MVRRWRNSGREGLRRALDNILNHEKHLGFIVRVQKSHQIFTEPSFFKAKTNFHGTALFFTDGPTFLGSVIETEKSCRHYTNEKTSEYNWVCMK